MVLNNLSTATCLGQSASALRAALPTTTLASCEPGSTYLPSSRPSVISAGLLPSTHSVGLHKYLLQTARGSQWTTCRLSFQGQHQLRHKDSTMSVASCQIAYRLQPDTQDTCSDLQLLTRNQQLSNAQAVAVPEFVDNPVPSQRQPHLRISSALAAPAQEPLFKEKAGVKPSFRYRWALPSDAPAIHALLNSPEYAGLLKPTALPEVEARISTQSLLAAECVSTGELLAASGCTVFAGAGERPALEALLTDQLQCWGEDAWGNLETAGWYHPAST